MRDKSGSIFKCRREVVRLKGMHFYGGVVGFFEALYFIAGSS